MMDGPGGRSAIRRGGRLRRIELLALVVFVVAARLEAAMSVSLAASPPGPAPVGTVISWKAQVDGAGSDLWYRFRVREPGGSFRMIRDFGPVSTLDWTALEEGAHEVEVSVRDHAGTETTTTRSTIQLDSRVQGNQAVLSPTSHPLVLLFSGPGCQSGRARVQFESSKGVRSNTPWKPCVPGRNLNFYLAGLASQSSYSARLVVEGRRGPVVGPPVALDTGNIPAGLAAPSVVQAAISPGLQNMLLQIPLGARAVATDLAGAPLWFGPSDLTYMTHPEAGGTFFGLLQSKTDPAREVVRRFDLVGMTLQETNAARVNEQLAALGKPPISGFHHEARSLADGKTVVLGMVEQILLDVQGSGPVDVIGDMIVVLDADFQVVWAWNSFDHLDISRRAVLGETCKVSGCDHHYLAADGNDWTHGNSVVDSPDGALLYSARHQDWLIKIDYQNGAGDGRVIWRLGKDGDFTFDSADPYPWFSHQHGAGYEPGSGSAISLFDNGNTRRTVIPGAFSRGQAIELDEARRTARLAVNVDLGVFSSALGSAQRLDDGTYHFEAGFIFDASSPSNVAAFSLQIDPPADVLSSLKLQRPVYRSFRLADLYGAAETPPPSGPRPVDFHQ